MYPDKLAQNIVQVHGERGIEWLDRLPKLISECESRWSLATLPAFGNLSFNYVAPAVRADGEEVVLKLRVPHPEFVTEMEALRLFRGRGCVRLLDSDSEMGVMLLERLRPGDLLSDLDDDEEGTSIAAGLMRRLWRPVPPKHPFPTIAIWARGLKRLRDRFDGATGPFPVALVERAEALFRELLATMARPVLLHADLHHYNIVSAQREPWLAIDPKGLVGEAEYELAAFLRNRLMSRPRPAALLARRVDQFVEALGFERERVVGWALAEAVLSAWWTYEDSGKVNDDDFAYAELLAEI